MENHDIAYFRNLWQTNNIDLENQCKNWENVCNNNEIPDEVRGEIRTAIGLARLLMNQKLKQFNGLIDDSEFNTGEKEITCLDLQGFWDMVYCEIEKINKCFTKLEKCKDNEWKFVEENTEKVFKKKVPVTKDFTVANKKNDSSKSHALAAKQRLAEAKKKMLAQRMQQKEQNLTEVTQPNVEGDKILTNESNKKLKQEVEVLEKVAESNDTNVSTKESAFTNGVSKKSSRQKSDVSAKNKENFITSDKTPSEKNVPVKLTKSRGKTEPSEPTKSGRKSKEVIKLQCITRSAKKALLAQQNGV